VLLGEMRRLLWAAVLASRCSMPETSELMIPSALTARSKRLSCFWEGRERRGFLSDGLRCGEAEEAEQEGRDEQAGSQRGQVGEAKSA